MGVMKEIKIGDGINGQRTYYYWNEYESREEALYYAKKIKHERKQEKMNIKYFIIESKEGWFLPVPRYIVYLNKKLRLL